MITGRLAAPDHAAPFSDAVLVDGGLAFLAGQGPISDGQPVLGSITEQARLTLGNIGTCLVRLGADASAVVSCRDGAESYSTRCRHCRSAATGRPSCEP
jgi:enamine deaminase RidA (YjgF/YER057c/UK114 family)